MEQAKTLAQANAELLARRARLEHGRQKDETPKPLASSPNLYNFRMPTPEEAAKAEAEAQARQKEYEEAETVRRAERAEEGRVRRLGRAMIPERHATRELNPKPEWMAALDSLKRNLGKG